MKTAALTLLFTGLASWAQAQQYRARQDDTSVFVPVPLSVESAFQKKFPTLTVDSCQLYHSDKKETEGDTYRFFTAQMPLQQPELGHWLNYADFDESGKLGEYDVEIRPDSLPARVKRTLNRLYDFEVRPDSLPALAKKRLTLHVLSEEMKKNGYTLRTYVWGKGDKAIGYLVYISKGYALKLHEVIRPNGKLVQIARFR